MEDRKKEYLTALILGLLAFCYYTLLCAKSWTWMFGSFDSGDWLMASQIWVVPQPYGSPLYILLGHLLNTLPFNLIHSMTVVLSCLPAAITVGLVYLTIRKLGYERKYAYLGSAVLLACGIFLSQATVIEEYTLAAMFITLAFYSYISEKKKLTMLFLGLGTAVHIIVLPITFLWLAVNYKQIREWGKPAVVYLGVCTIFYSVILILMALDTPNIIAGDLSIGAINAYLGSTGTIGKISLHDTPLRLLQAVSVILLGFGVCIVPMIYGLRKPWNNVLKVMLLTIVFCAWLYITNTDFTTWTFMCFAIPIACVAIAMGLSRLPKWIHYTVIVWVFVIMCINAFWLNADLLTKQNLEPQYFYNATMRLPDDSAVVCSRGGAYGMTVMYTIGSGKDLIPLFLQHEEGWNNQGYLDYLDWVQNHHATEGDNWIEQIEYCLDVGKAVYIPYYILPPEWQENIDSTYVSKYVNEYYRQITMEMPKVHPVQGE